MIFLACEHHFLKNGKVNENSKASFHVHNSPYITRFKGRTAVTFEKRCSIFRSLWLPLTPVPYHSPYTVIMILTTASMQWTYITLGNWHWHAWLVSWLCCFLHKHISQLPLSPHMAWLLLFICSGRESSLWKINTLNPESKVYNNGNKICCKWEQWNEQFILLLCL